MNDARTHPLLCDNGAVTELGVIAYAGIPICTSDGLVLGSFCVIDTKPRVWTIEEIEILTDLTKSVMMKIELISAIREATQRTAEVVSSEARKDAIMEAAIDCIITLDRQGRILEFNPAAERVFGYRAGDVIGRTLVDLILPPHRGESHHTGLKRYLASASPHVLGKRIEISAMRSDGTEFPVELTVSVSNDTRPLFTVYLRDNTESRNTAGAMERSRAMLDAIQRAQRQFIEGDARASFDDLLQNLLTLTNSEYGFIGEIRHEADGTPYIKTHSTTKIVRDPETRDLLKLDGTAGPELSKLKTLLGVVLTGGQRVISNAPCRVARTGAPPNDHARMESFLGLPFYHGNELVGMVGIANRPEGYDDELCDYLAPFLATCSSLIAAYRVRQQRTQVQESLRAERDFVSAVLETVGALVVVVDSSGRIVGFNRTCEEVSGYSSEEIIGKLAWELPYVLEANRAPLIRFWKEFQGRKMPATYESEWLSFNGEVRLLNWSYTVLGDPSGQITNMVACGIDITAKRANEAALAQARRNEVEIGTRIQQNLLVHKPLASICGCSIGTLSRASAHIDGDFFDFVTYDGSCFDVLIGDVMGKGIPAALLGAASKSHFQRAIRRLQIFMRQFWRLPSPEEILTAVHAAATPELASLNSFITLCYARFEPMKGRMQLIDCGHTRTIHFHARTHSCSFVTGDNLPLGVREDEVYQPLTIALETEDTLLFYSDGLTDARNPSGEFFGEEGLTAAVLSAAHLKPQELMDSIAERIVAFTGDKFADDLTCVAVRFDDTTRPSSLRRTVQEFTSSLLELEAIRDFVSEFCGSQIPQPLNDEVINLVILGVHEALTNVITHAYGGRQDQLIQFIIDYSLDRIAFHLYDCGLSFDPTATAEPDFDGSRDDGFGMFIIAQCMDEVLYERDDLGRNHTTLIRNIAECDHRNPEERGSRYDI